MYKTLGRSGRLQSGGECMPGGYRSVDHKFRDLLVRAKQMVEPIVS